MKQIRMKEKKDGEKTCTQEKRQCGEEKMKDPESLR